MKVLFLCHSLKIGGIENYILRFALWIQRNFPKHEIHLVLKSGEFGPYKPDFQNAGVILHSLKLGYFNPLQYSHFFQFLKANHFNVICDFGGDFGAFPVFCAYLARTSRRIVFYRNARNAYLNTMPRKIYQLILNRIVRIFSTHILSNSKDAFDYYYRNYPFDKDVRFKIIRNGIPYGTILAPDKIATIRENIGILTGQKLVLHVGSGRWEKNHTIMLETAKLIQNKFNNVIFYFVGSGVQERYGEISREMGLRNVRFLGERRDVYNLLQAADIFLFPSLTEGQPNALLEAVINGLPFIASNIASIKESLSPVWGERWLFPPENIEQCYELIQEHLNKNFRKDQKFKNLVAWCNNNYAENNRFLEFLNVLL